MEATLLVAARSSRGGDGGGDHTRGRGERTASYFSGQGRKDIFITPSIP
jgi:hypothetical protein